MISKISVKILKFAKSCLDRTWAFPPMFESNKPQHSGGLLIGISPGSLFHFLLHPHCSHIITALTQEIECIVSIHTGNFIRHSSAQLVGATVRPMCSLHSYFPSLSTKMYWDGTRKPDYFSRTCIAPVITFAHWQSRHFVLAN